MRTVILLVYICFSSVHALKCYVCSSATTNEKCNQDIQSCQAPLDTCMTTVDTLGDLKAIVKQCASAATCAGAASGASVNTEGDGNRVTCCRTHMCNLNGATAVQLHTLLLGLLSVLLVTV